MPPRTFEIDVPAAVLDDLKQRLVRTRWPAPIPGQAWDYGANVDFVRDFCDYWANDFDWPAKQRELNQLAGFVANVDGVDLHFWHIRGKSANPLPLLLIHGWPGSMYEFFRLAAPLSDPESHGGEPADAFDLVIPALPGFGFGGRPSEPGWGITRIAAALNTLMTRELGYERYGVQGGDWGGIISAKMASAHAKHVVGAHLNFVVAGPPADMTEADREATARRDAFQANETGYSNVQGTKPDSLTVAQSDSPAGLAAWVLEKFRTWSDCDGDLDSTFSREDLATNLMFYWAPNSTASSARIYYEARRDPGAFRFPRPETPVGIAAFPKEPWIVPRSWAEARFNVTRWTDMPRGGHFAAMEQADLLVEDIRAFFRDFR